MEYINKIELQGRVGSVRARVIDDTHAQFFSVATEYAYQMDNGAQCYEVTWHNVVAWDKTEVVKGDMVRVSGRMRQCRYTGTDGMDRSSHEVVATEVEVIAHEDEDARRAEVRKALNDLYHQRLTESLLNENLSAIFGKKITVEQGLYDEDWTGDDYFTFSVDDEEVGGYFDIYYLKMNRDEYFYITEVDIYFE